ncbi:C39 family peptidase [Secundilactobacillus hailunensis]|uniref:C39 family peptidase n=1 Tax=Secundilactobacillus hailunensis TaxID=2559923 RepID=A0ABW1T7B3_9LACO|nr:C39 family peptidase [Secundilactobacillus hailunensis]
MKFSKFLFGTTIGLAAGLLALYYKGDKRVQAPAKKPNTKVFDDFSAVDLSEFTDHLTLAAADKTALVLDQNDDEYVSAGSLTTPVFTLPPFKNLVASWNALTPDGTAVQVEARINQAGRWSGWHSWGRWSTKHLSGSVKNDQADSLAGIDTDTLTVKAGVGTKAQLRVHLYTENAQQTPVLKLLAASVKPVHQDLMVDSHAVTVDKVIATPAYSQEIRDPKLAPGICSPTTVSMAINRQNADILPEELALHNLDTTYDGFGNWSFSTAAAGSMGYRAYVAYTDLDGLRRQILAGYPVGVSVHYTNDPNNGKLPYVENATGDTVGHLLLVTGFTTLNGVDYVAVNDSYADSNEDAKRLYRLEQFSEAWHSRVAYIIDDNYQGYKQLMQPSRESADLVANDDQTAFTLQKDGETISITAEMLNQTEPFDENATTIAYTLNDGGQFDTTAQQHFDYATVDDEGRIKLDLATIKQAHPKATTLTVYVVRMVDSTLVGTISLANKNA